MDANVSQEKREKNKHNYTQKKKMKFLKKCVVLYSVYCVLKKWYLTHIVRVNEAIIIILVAAITAVLILARKAKVYAHTFNLRCSNLTYNDTASLTSLFGFEPQKIF